MKKTGRILYLNKEAQLIDRQLQGESVGASAPLHYGVNTDAMISGKACTFGYTGEILGPYFLENFQEYTFHNLSGRLHKLQ